MENPRPEKVAVVDEVKERLSAADATVLADYRGIDVPGMAELRRSLREAGGDIKIYKNSLARFAAQDLGLEIEDMLVGPTAFAFVTKGEGGTGDPVLVAKALREFGKGNDNLDIKGGLLGDRLLTPDEIDQLAKVAPRDELLARFAGGLAAPLQQMAGLLQAMPRNLAYGLAALIDERGGPEAAADAAGEADDSTDAASSRSDTGAETDADAEDGEPEDAEATDAEPSGSDEDATDDDASDDDESEDDQAEESASDDSDSEEG